MFSGLIVWAEQSTGVFFLRRATTPLPALLSCPQFLLHAAVKPMTHTNYSLHGNCKGTVVTHVP